MLDFFEGVMNNVDLSISSFSWGDRICYANYLAQTYFYVRHSTRLLACSAARFSKQQEDLFRRFVAHMNEEKGHERLAETDLKNLGFDILDFKELPETMLLYEPQYYKIEHKDPVALLGYILVLEAASIRKTPEIYDSIRKEFGVKSSNFLRVHVGDDPDHLAKAFKALEGLSPTQIDLVKENILQTGNAFQIFLRAINEEQAPKKMVAQKQ